MKPHPCAAKVQLSRSKDVTAISFKTRNSVEKMKSSSSRKLNSRVCMSWPEALTSLQTWDAVYRVFFTTLVACTGSKSAKILNHVVKDNPP